MVVSQYPKRTNTLLWPHFKLTLATRRLKGGCKLVVLCHTIYNLESYVEKSYHPVCALLSYRSFIGRLPPELLFAFFGQKAKSNSNGDVSTLPPKYLAPIARANHVDQTH